MQTICYDGAKSALASHSENASHVHDLSRIIGPPRRHPLPPAPTWFHVDRAVGRDRHHRLARRLCCLPAVQQAREVLAARNARTISSRSAWRCKTTSRPARSFRPGYISSPRRHRHGARRSNFNDAGPGWSWLALSMPYMEETGIIGHVEHEADLLGSGERRRRGDAGFDVSLPERRLWPESQPKRHVQHHRHQSAADAGQSSSADRTTFPASAAARSGAVGRSRSSRTAPSIATAPRAAKDVTDGLSKTVFAGERSSNLADSVWPGAVPGSGHFAYAPFASIGSGGFNTNYDGPGAMSAPTAAPVLTKTRSSSIPPTAPTAIAIRCSRLIRAGRTFCWATARSASTSTSHRYRCGSL